MPIKKFFFDFQTSCHRTSKILNPNAQMNLWLCVECEFQLVIPENGCDTRPCARRRHTTLLCLFVPVRGKEIYITERDGTRTSQRTRCARLPSLHCLPLCLSFCSSAHSHTHTYSRAGVHNICIFLWLCTRQQAMMAAARLALRSVVLLPAAPDCKNNTRCCCILQSEYAINIGVLVWKYGNILLSGELYLSLSWIFSSKMCALSLLSHGLTRSAHKPLDSLACRWRKREENKMPFSLSGSELFSQRP